MRESGRPGRATGPLDHASWGLPLLLLGLCLGGMTLAGDLRERPGLFLALYGAGFVGYAAALAGAGRRLPSGRTGFLLVLGTAMLLRLAILPSSPTLSDDVYRYLWDGRVQQHGINPYRYAPDAPELEGLRDEVWERINHKEIPTIYPPVMQGVFRAAAWLAPSVIGFKGLLLLFDLVLIGIVWKLAILGDRTPRDVAIYAWNPLVIVEVAGSGHNDVIAVTLLMAALCYLIQARRGLSTTALSLAALSKLLPLLLVPTFLRRTPLRVLWLLPVLLVLGYLPFAGAGTDVFHGLSEYGHRWEGNDFLFRGLLELLRLVDPSRPLTELLHRVGRRTGLGEALDPLLIYTAPRFLARILAFLVMGLAAIYVSFKPWVATREALVALAVALLLAPTLHPWYLLWVAPLLALHRSRGLLLWTALVALSYAFPPVAGYDPYAGPLLFLEYAPVLALLVVDVVLFRLRPPGSPFRDPEPAEPPGPGAGGGRGGEFLV